MSARPLALAALVALVGSVALLLRPSRVHAPVRKAITRDALSVVPRNRLQEDSLRAQIARSAQSKDLKVQDRVGHARLVLGYSESKRDMQAARTTFLRAAREYRGTGAMGADWGGIPDQAAYQAAVCLIVQGKKEEARREFVCFLKDRKYSPLAHAAYRRLVRLNGGDTTPEYEALLQRAVSAQEARIRFETSVCGPKTIEYLLPQLGRSRTDYKTLAKLCGTTDKGTTLEGMRKGLKATGVESYAYRLNRKDLASAPLPAILLESDHYVALLRVEGDRADYYDSRYKSERTSKLPPLDNPDFTANLILFSKPELKP